jgi:hypothetical protein
MENAIVIVSGLPRSGTSLMMQMLESGGMPLVSDDLRPADVDNPRGYYELERVRRLRTDASWLGETRGKVIKVISQLLYELPATEKYQIVFMERDLGEILASQEKMLVRLGRSAAPREEIQQSYTRHLAKLHAWLEQQSHLAVLRVSYNELLQQPAPAAQRVSEFLGRELNLANMVRCVDPALYRNR